MRKSALFFFLILLSLFIPQAFAVGYVNTEVMNFYNENTTDYKLELGCGFSETLCGKFSRLENALFYEIFKVCKIFNE